jgi:hypothetical protein
MSAVLHAFTGDNDIRRSGYRPNKRGRFASSGVAILFEKPPSYLVYFNRTEAVTIEIGLDINKVFLSKNEKKSSSLSRYHVGLLTDLPHFWPSIVQLLLRHASMVFFPSGDDIC